MSGSRQCSPETREKIRQALLGHKVSEETRAKLQKRIMWTCSDCGVTRSLPPSLAKHKRCLACASVINTAALNEQRVGTKRKKWLKALRASVPQVREKLIGRKLMTPLTMRNSKQHHSAKHFTVCSPAGVRYQVDNICAFVQNNSHLFDTEDVKNRSKTKTYQSRASVGIGSLCKRSANVGSWKGWVLSYGERDRLNRALS